MPSRDTLLQAKTKGSAVIDPNYRAVCIKKKNDWNQDKEQPWRKSTERTSPDQDRPTGSEGKGHQRTGGVPEGRLGRQTGATLSRAC